jgi:CheY-like chemotaxis protein
MPPELLEKAFVPFFSTKTKDKGSGLGLSMVRELARRNHGEIEIWSEINRGTIVSITLPCGPPEYMSSTSPQGTTSKEGPITILVADDETTVRDTLLAALSRQGYIVCAAPDGRSILEELKRRINECDLVVIDDGMPSMSARELISAIRIIAPKLPMLLTSGDPSRVEILSADFEPCAFLAKPFGLDELYTRIELLIRAR